MKAKITGGSSGQREAVCVWSGLKEPCMGILPWVSSICMYRRAFGI